MGRRKRVSELTQKDLEYARHVFARRSRRAQTLDRRYAGRVPVYFETWLRNPGRYDLPGVDLGKEKREMWARYEILPRGAYGGGEHHIATAFIVVGDEVLRLGEAKRRGVAKVRRKQEEILEVRVPKKARVVEAYLLAEGGKWYLMDVKVPGDYSAIKKSTKKEEGVVIGERFVPLVRKGRPVWFNINEDVVWQARKSGRLVAAEVGGKVVVAGDTFPRRRDLRGIGGEFVKELRLPIDLGAWGRNVWVFPKEKKRDLSKLGVSFVKLFMI